ncbi:hypothetical protein OQA88_10590 [Cercophora sp. LCS_1]
MTLESKGTASRAFSVFLRIGQLVCGGIVLGLLGRFFYLFDNAGMTDPSARLVYAAVIAALSIIFALVLIPPLAYSFWLFPIDVFMFAAWLVAFCVLETLTGINTCNSDWYTTYWGYYWGRWYLVGRPGVNVNWTGCSAWRTVLAFSFIGSICFLLSAILGVYWVFEHGRAKERRHRFLRRRRATKVEPTGGIFQPSTSPIYDGTNPGTLGGTVPAEPTTTSATAPGMTPEPINTNTTRDPAAAV